jgi:hypothetical protein
MELRSCQDRVTLFDMKGITVKLPEPTLRRLRDEARAAGRSVAAVVRDRIETAPDESTSSVHARAADLAGSLAGRRRVASNSRKRFTRS